MFRKEGDKRKVKGESVIIMQFCFLMVVEDENCLFLYLGRY